MQSALALALSALVPRAVLAQPGVHLHDYGKSPRPGRKLGHCTLVAATALERSVRTRRLLRELSRALDGGPGKTRYTERR